ncbi:hypothetical protein [Bradyrhizobium uaiense]|uniref:hypothetical protein n=1 Tax=Bradyrhizobium uaiense TaxID=2594946 RepID=UPI0013CFEE4C|nr:hypothetical protein [Bradyrhizobium uaiense]
MRNEQRPGAIPAFLIAIATFFSVIPGRAKREPGIHPDAYDAVNGFQVCAWRRIPE